jgi:hypothetical protein
MVVTNGEQEDNTDSDLISVCKVMGDQDAVKELKRTFVLLWVGAWMTQCSWRDQITLLHLIAVSIVLILHNHKVIREHITLSKSHTLFSLTEFAFDEHRVEFTPANIDHEISTSETHPLTVKTVPNNSDSISLLKIPEKALPEPQTWFCVLDGQTKETGSDTTDLLSKGWGRLSLQGGQIYIEVYEEDSSSFTFHKKLVPTAWYGAPHEGVVDNGVCPKCVIRNLELL